MLSTIDLDLPTFTRCEYTRQSTAYLHLTICLFTAPSTAHSWLSTILQTTSTARKYTVFCCRGIKSPWADQIFGRIRKQYENRCQSRRKATIFPQQLFYHYEQLHDKETSTWLRPCRRWGTFPSRQQCHVETFLLQAWGWPERVYSS